MLTLDKAAGRLFNHDRNECFDPVGRRWNATNVSGGIAISLLAAATWLQRESGHPFRVPVGVIGPRDATDEQIAAAESVGAALGSIGLSVICGGREGIMEAVCRGVASAGGISVGLLPDTDPARANPHVSIPIATGIGEARNALIARAAFCLVAIGDSYGTLSEVALGLQFGRQVIGLSGAAKVAGVRHFDSVEGGVDAVAALALGLD
jgi:uncharacterized protein (TIGR00725 family)